MRNPGLLLLFIAILIGCKTEEPKTIAQITNDKIVLDGGKEIPLANTPGKFPSTLFIVRHAEKADSTAQSGLTTKGVERAEKLATLLKDVELGGIFSTSYFRAMETARPTAESHKVTVYNYNPTEFERTYEMMFTHKIGEKFLLIGHSNNIPEILKSFGDTTNVVIGEKDYDNFYVIQSWGDSTNTRTQINHLKY
jgi:phosphohistidine phosphatase SixA